MPDPHELLSVLREWVQKAENDLSAAWATSRLGRKTPADIVCFHAQQCIEKYIKAYLVLRQVRFPRTHDMKTLVELVPGRSRPPLDAQEQERFSRYAVISRYPEDDRPPTLADAREAVKVARRVRVWCRKLLPPVALRKKAPERE
jgi:HEPN domain-containing protein